MVGLRVVILSRSARGGDGPAWGLGQDSKIVEQVLREIHAGGHTRVESVDHLDPTSFYGSPRRPRPVDVQIHLEVPCRAAWPWARINIVVVNPEWWPRAAWNWVLAPVSEGGADIIVFKSAVARSLYPEVDEKRARVIMWRAGPDISTALGALRPGVAGALNGFLYLIGASSNKLAAAQTIVNAWQSAWPPLHIVGTSRVVDTLRPLAELKTNITFQLPFVSDSERIAAQMTYKYHIVASVAEGFGYTFAEAAAIGALPLWTGIEIYNELWKPIVGDTGRIPVSAGTNTMHRDIPCNFSLMDVVIGVESLLKLPNEDAHRISGALRHHAAVRNKEFRSSWKQLMGVVSKMRGREVLVPPRPIPAGELPHVAVITLTRNRPRWFANMAQNILKADYPKDKLTWVVADDGDLGRVDGDIMKFQSVNRDVHVKYLSLPKKLDIGEKRNMAIKNAPADCSVFVMMDDDDHYPPSSIRLRVAWMTALRVNCVYCSVLPMYDCKRYISAMNVPPLDLAPAERISEATLCFRREFWNDLQFPGAVSVAEGEAFVSSRELATAEIPPEGVIVSFLHGKNATSRRVPESSEANGCHYGFDDEYFMYLCEMGEAPAS